MPAARPRQSTIDFGFPFKGWNTAGPVMQQPKGTSRDLLNVRPFVGADANDRGRGGQRAGMVKANPITLTPTTGGGVQALAQVTLGGTASHTYIARGAASFFNDSFATLGTLGVTCDTTLFQAGRVGSTLQATFTSDFGVVDDNVKQAVHVASAGQLILKPRTVVGANAVSILTNDTVTRPADGQEWVLVFNADTAAAGTEVSLIVYATTPPAALSSNMLWTSVGLTDREVIAFQGGISGSLTLPAQLAGTITMQLAVFNAKIVLGTIVADVRLSINGQLIYDSSTGQTAAGIGVGDGFSIPAKGIAAEGRRPGAVAPFALTDFQWRAGFGARFGTANNNTITVGQFSGYPVIVTTIPPVSRSVHLVAIAQGDIFDGSSAANLIDVDAGVVATNIIPSFGQFAGKLYVVDGTSSIIYDPTTAAVSTWTATKGALPANCRICCVYRGRLVLANQPGNEQNIFMSRAGDPLDFDYAPVVPDVLMPVALNASSAAGRVGQAVYALMPFQDDVMLIGLDGSIFAMTGDPAAGGAVTTITDQIGVFSQTSWCSDPNGTLYFVGTGGFFSMGQGSPPQNLSSDKVPQFFAAIDRSSTAVTCVWDADRHGCWIFITPTSSAAGPGKHLWYDQRTGGFFPASFAIAGLDPLCALAFDGDGPADRVVLMGCKDGYVRRFDNTASTDDTLAMSSYCLIGPAQPSGTFGDTAIQRVESVFGGDTTGVTLGMLIGKDAPTAGLAAPQSVGGVMAGAGRQTPVLTRFRGNTFYLKVAGVAGSFWSMEQIQALASYAGPQR